MNNLGGMVFLVVGITFGYWVLTGKATNFLHALNTGSGGGPPTPTTPVSDPNPSGIPLDVSIPSSVLDATFGAGNWDNMPEQFYAAPYIAPGGGGAGGYLR